MSDSRYKSETRIKGDRKPRANYCGSCGQECDGLLCDDCVYQFETYSGYNIDSEEIRGTR